MDDDRVATCLLLTVMFNISGARKWNKKIKIKTNNIGKNIPVADEIIWTISFEHKMVKEMKRKMLWYDKLAFKNIILSKWVSYRKDYLSTQFPELSLTKYFHYQQQNDSYKTFFQSLNIFKRKKKSTLKNGLKSNNSFQLSWCCTVQI